LGAPTIISTFVASRRINSQRQSGRKREVCELAASNSGAAGLARTTSSTIARPPARP
jgi:hypothetical protein